MVLLTVAVGCGDAHYDSRLAAIDSTPRLGSCHYASNTSRQFESFLK